MFKTGLTTRLVVTFSLGLFLTASAIVALIEWQKAEWFWFTGRFPDRWAGYTRTDFNYLMLFTFATPLAFCLLFTVFQYFIRKSAGQGHKCMYLTSIIVPSLLLIALIVVSQAWSHNITQCGILGCVNTESKKWLPYDPPRPEASMGWRSMTALMTQFAAICTLIAIVVNAVKNWSIVSKTKEIAEYQKTALLDPITNFPTHHGTIPESVKIQGKRQSKFSYCVPFLLFVISILFLAACLFVSTYIPNNWEYWTPSRIAYKSAMKATTIEAECGNWPQQHCPEYPWATMKTYVLELTKYWNLNFFPSNTMFYIYLAIVPSFLIIQQYSFTLASFFSRKIRIQYRSLGYFLLSPLILCGVIRANQHYSLRLRTAFFSINELLWIALTTAVTYSTFHYWYFDHNFVNLWPDKSVIFSERISRTFGQVAVIFFSFLMFPASRNSPMYSILGLSWEGAMKYHRWLGILFLLFSFLHMAFVYLWYYDTGSFPRDLWAIPNHLEQSIDNFTVPHLQWIFWMSLITIGILAGFDSIRRKRFELFLFFHHVSYLVLIPALLWHATASWEFMLPGCVLWVIDRSMRVFRSSRAVFIPTIPELESGGYTSASTWGLPSSIAQGTPGCSVVQYGQSGEIIELVLCAPGLDVLPGHYIFMNVAEVSLFEWHPFTVSSSSGPDSGFISFHIKTMGEGTWTQSLAKLIKENSASGITPQQGLTISLDGPHGHIIDFKQYDNILLVSGGIGITPCKAIFESMISSVIHDPQYRNNNIDTDDEAPPKRRVHFLSTTKDPSSYHIMKHSIESIANAHDISPVHDIFSLSLYATQSNPNAVQSERGVNDRYVDDHNRFSTSFDDRKSISGALPAYDEAITGNNKTTDDKSNMNLNKSRNSNNNADNSNTDSDSNTERVRQYIESESIFNIRGLAEALVIGKRPNIESELDEAVNTQNNFNNVNTNSTSHIPFDRLEYNTVDPSRTLVFVCGPDALVDECEGIANKRGWSFHKETFLL